MLIINKKTKTSYIKPNKQFVNKLNNNLSILPCIILKDTNYNTDKFIEKNMYMNLIENFENLVINTEFDLENFDLYINIENIKKDFKKLIYNKLNLLL